MLKFIKFSIILLLLVNFFIGVSSVRAGGLLPDQTGPDCPADSPDCGNYSLNDIVRTAVKVSEFILGIVGSLALLAFVAGGLMMMLSAGNAEWVKRGQQTLIGAVVGLAIVFTSYTIIYFVYKSLGINFTGKSEFPTAATEPAPAPAETAPAPAPAETAPAPAPAETAYEICIKECSKQLDSCLIAFSNRGFNVFYPTLEDCYNQEETCIAGCNK